jgi:outer membrane immunogenic protein
MRIVAALCGLLATSNLAWSADIAPATYPAPAPIYTPPPAPPPPYNWSGPYIGLNGGYGFATASSTAALGGVSATGSENLSGFVGGGQFGFNYQAGAAVFGVEADIDGSSQSITTTSGGLSETDKITYIGTVRGRIGVAFDRLLVYGTAGGGYGEFTSSLTAAGIGSVSGSQSHFLWTAGAGIEYGITNNISARLEYLYADTGNLTLATVGALTLTGRVQDNLVRAGVNFRLPMERSP